MNTSAAARGRAQHIRRARARLVRSGRCWSETGGWFHQSTQAAVAYSTSTRVFKGPAWKTSVADGSVFYRSMIDSISPSS